MISLDVIFGSFSISESTHPPKPYPAKPTSSLDGGESKCSEFGLFFLNLRINPSPPTFGIHGLSLSSWPIICQIFRLGPAN
uniref:Uncharacterized protein n=1 Tax=Medicago truncatula TaxID=3880 RepID=Q1RU89_MEDTR|nr:hypothetical protein MtrDRAFT_AC153123g19v2 [Medicago truncatula]